jgi:hypothetical protein
MKKLFLLLLLSNMMLNSQANEQDKVQSAVEIFFEGFHNKDSILIKSVVHKSFSLNSASLRNNQSTLSNFDGDQFIKAVVTRSDDPAWKEILTSFEIKIDGILSNAWVGYEFWLGDKMSHCGVNSISLIKEEDSWKIFNISDSRRRDCN